METIEQNGTKQQERVNDLSKFVGKYVCYGNKDGGFCFGKIKNVVKVNMVNGVKPCFVLTERMSSFNGKAVIKHDNDTLLCVSSIDLTRDVIEKNGADLEKLTNDELFLIIMCADIGEIDGLNRGIANLIKSKGEVAVESAKKTLSERMGKAT